MSLRRTIPGSLAAVLAVASMVSSAAAEELVLKSGQRISGTIVGYENDMFRVETEFGVALVRKDKVASIQVAGPGGALPKQSETKTRVATPKAAADKPEKAADPGVTPAGGSMDTAKTAATPAPDEVRKEVQVAPVKPVPPPPVSRPVDEPLPVHLQEHVEGNTYVNDTFQFAMYKPPGWKIYEGVPRETGSGIMAVGTEDEQTLLIVDRQVWSGTPDLKTDQVEARLRRTYQEFQKLSEEPVQCGGHPAIRRAFKGVLDDVEWHGIAVHVAHGNTVFGIIGLTSAETFQFQQAVIGKIINSFRFLSSASEVLP